jgi:DivIVA domain-containing protein
MDLTPEAIREARFREAWRGYDRSDVDLFLDEMAFAIGGPSAAAGAIADAKATVESLRADAAALRAEIARLEADRDELGATLARIAAHVTGERARLRAVFNELSARVDADLTVGSVPEATSGLDLDELTATEAANDEFFADLRASIAGDDGSGLFRKRRHG